MSQGNPHDAYFKAAFSDPRVAAEAIKRRLPPAAVARLDWSALEPVPAEFVGEDLTGRRADLVFKAPLAGHEAFIFLLFEHQSSTDGLMPVRAVIYIVRIWERWLREHPGQRPPAIIPIVLYHGERPWSGPVSLHQTIDLPPDLLDALAPHLPGFELVVDDLSRASEDEIERSTRDTLAMLALLLLKSGAHAPDPMTTRLLGHLAAAMADEPGRAAVERAVRYLYNVAEFDGDRLRARLAEAGTDKQLEEVIMTAADRIRAEGFEKGIERGIEQGIEQGQAQGRVVVLLRLLGLKFGELPDDVRARIERADIPTLDRWAERILTAPDLDSAID